MKKFLYKAKGANGKVVTGTVSAKDAIEAESVLMKNNLIAMDIVPSKEPLSGFFSNHFFKVNSKDRAVFARQLSTMISAGLTVPKSIKIAAAQARNDRLRTIYLDVFQDIEEGSSFSDALSRHPEAFDQIFVSVIGAGESTGKLDVVLKNIAEQLENDTNFVGKVKSAMYYPGFILFALVVIGIYMLVKVIPPLKVLFDQNKAELPIATKILLGLSNLFTNYWWAVLIVAIALGLILRFFLNSKSGDTFKANLQVKTPGFKKLFEGMCMYRLTQVLSMLLGAGVPLLSALKISASVVNNEIYEKSLLSVASYVERGVPLSTQLLKEPIFPALVGQMAAVGEETGKLDEVLGKIADYYKETTDQMIRSLSSLIEPAILVLMGLAVAFLVFAVLVPIYSLSQMQ